MPVIIPQIDTKINSILCLTIHFSTWFELKKPRTFEAFLYLACPAGFEPATYCLEGNCSIRLSHGHKTNSWNSAQTCGQFLCNILCNKYVTLYIQLHTIQSICVKFYTELIFTHTRINPAFIHLYPILSIRITDN